MINSEPDCGRQHVTIKKNKYKYMKTRYLPILLLILSLISFSSFSQTENDEPLLGLPGDDLDLYAVLDLFQKSKTIEDFEKSLNDGKAGIVNLDLNNDGKVDFIKVVTEQDGDDFLFVLQDLVSEKETQDVAVIAVSKDAAGKVSMQVIGDEALYGKDYVVEPRTEATESVTSNPAYVGDDPVTVNVQATTEVVVVQSAPVVQYVYSPVYVPYYPTYHYGYYPNYWRTAAVIGIGIYRHNHWHNHGHYHGGRGNTNVNVNVNNSKHYNNYNNNKRNTSNTVNNNVKNGNFKTAGQGGSRPSTSQGGRGSNGASNSNRASTNPSKSQAGRTSNGASTSNRSSNSNKASSSNRASTSPSTTNRSSTNRSTSPSSSNRSSASRSMGSSRSSGASRSSGGRSGGGGGRRR